METHSLLIGGFLVELVSVSILFYRKVKTLKSLRVKRVRAYRR